MITLRYPGQLSPQYASFKAELLQTAAIKNAGRSSHVPFERLLDSQNGSA